MDVIYVYASSLHGRVDVVDVLEQLYRVLGRRVPHVQYAEAGSLEEDTPNIRSYAQTEMGQRNL